MKGKATTKVPEKRSHDNVKHILPGLGEIASGTWKPTELEQEQMLTHLNTCVYCQVNIEIAAAATLAKMEEDSSEDSTRKILLRLKEAFHKRQEWEEDIAAYTETLEARGPEEANKRFPVLAEHLRYCEACKAEVEDLRGVLRQAELDGLIAPLRENVKGRA